MARLTTQNTVMQSAAGATGNGNVIDCVGMGLLAMQVTGTFTGTVTFEATVDGSNYVSVQVRNIADGSVGTTATAPGIFTADVLGLANVRARVSAWTNGTITVHGMAIAAGGASVSADIDVAGTEAVTVAQLPAALAAGGGLKVEGVAGGVAQPISAASLPLPTGASTSVLQGGGLPAALAAGGGLKVEGVAGGVAQPISAASLPLPTGASTSVLQGGGLPAALAAGGGLKVEGVAGGVAQPVSAAALPLPAGASTSALQGAGLPAALGAGGGVKVDGSGTALPISAAALPLPAGASTSALQGAGLPAALGAGGGVKVDGSGTALPVSAAALPLPAGAATSALQGAGLPAALGAGGGVKIDGSGTAVPVSAAALPLPAGAAIEAKQNDGLSVTATLTVTNGVYTIQDVVGGLITFAAAVRANGEEAHLTDLVLTGITSALAYELWLLNADLATPLADNAAMAIVAADQPKVLGVIPVSTADCYQAGAAGVYSAYVRNIGANVKAGAATTSVYAYLKCLQVTSPGVTTLYLTAKFQYAS